MKPNLLKIIPSIENSLVIKTDRMLATQWHYHPEVELLYCISGKGTNYIGNSIQVIEEGELLLCGENLPHTRLADSNFYEKNPMEKPEAIVVQFRRDFLGAGFFSVQEFRHIKNLLDRASKGLRFSGITKDNIGARMIKIREKQGVAVILELLSLLESLALSEEYDYINSVDYVVDAHEKSSEKINKVYQYTIGHFLEDISLGTVAGLTNHSKSAFCRFFKSHTRKTYFQYLNEIRVANACRLLRESDEDITRACYASGFNNLSNFHKQFKKVVGKTPTEYRIKVLSQLAKSQSA